MRLKINYLSRKSDYIKVSEEVNYILGLNLI